MCEEMRWNRTLVIWYIFPCPFAAQCCNTMKKQLSMLLFAGSGVMSMTNKADKLNILRLLVLMPASKSFCLGLHALEIIADEVEGMHHQLKINSSTKLNK